MFNLINSPENKKYKRWQKLLKRKYRELEGLYLIEGLKLVEEAIKNKKNIDELIIDSTAEEAIVNRVSELIGDRNIHAYVLESKLYNKLSQVENGLGIMAVVGKEDFGLAEFADSITQARPGGCGNVVVLDRLQDPGNIGTIIRTADGAGFGGIIVMKGTADIYSPKVVRAAVGSIFRMPILFVEDNNQLIDALKYLQKKMIITSFDTDNYHYDVNLADNTAIVIGNEGQGVSEELINKADIKVKIPMYGNIDSLNASVAAGILMYEAMRQAKSDK